ncbi:MAG: hypothetical protein IKQ23_13660 [Treponema sp.]|nr:hypothetical protein [Treponema sp.]
MKIHRIDFELLFTFLAALFFAKGLPPFRSRSSRFPHSLAVVQSSGRLQRGSTPCRACLGKACYKLQTEYSYFFNSSMATSIAEKKL